MGVLCSTVMTGHQSFGIWIKREGRKSLCRSIRAVISKLRLLAHRNHLKIEDLLVRFLLKHGISCATIPRLTVPTPSDLDAGPPLTLSTAKLLANGSGNPDW